jgi:hypothetical protein
VALAAPSAADASDGGVEWAQVTPELFAQLHFGKKSFDIQV